MLEALQKFFDVFGATIVVPVMILIVSLFLKVSPKRAFFSALRAGVGLTGFGWVISAFTPLEPSTSSKWLTRQGSICLSLTSVGKRVL